MILSYPKRTLLLVGGVPGSGKSTLIKNLLLRSGARREIRFLSADDYRGHEQLQRGYGYHDFVKECIPAAREKYMADFAKALEQGDSIVAEAAYLTEFSRHGMLVPASEAGYSANLLVLKASLQQCLDGVASRARTVERNTVRRYFKDFLSLERRILNGDVPEGLDSIVMVDRHDVVEAITFEA